MVKIGKKYSAEDDKFKTLSEIYQKNNTDPKENKQTFSELFYSLQKKNSVLFAIIFLGVISLFLGFFSFKKSVIAPYKNPEQKQDKLAVQNLPQESSAVADLLGLKQKDTDFDNLSDYDELYNYNTSPYLKDSDSDGVSDSQEIKVGSDPNCPASQNCFNLNSLVSGEEESNAEETEVPTFPVTTLPSGQVNPLELREILKQTGMSEADLEELDDQTLLQAYNEAMALTQKDSISAPENSLLESIEKLSPQQIRELLKERGLSDEILDSISDDELMDVVVESLK